MANPHHNGGWYRRVRAALGALEPLVCGLCGRVIDKGLRHPHPGSYTLDMRVPRARGGQRVAENYRPAHRICNMKRGAGDRKQDGMRITDEEEP